MATVVAEEVEEQVPEEVTYVSQFGLDELPLELVERLAGLLDDEDLLSCTKVSSAWWRATNANSIWKPRCQARGWTPEMMDDTANSEVSKNGGEKVCEWRRVFDFHVELTSGWTWGLWKGRHKLIAGPPSVPVFCVHSDGKVIATGHQDAAVNVWKNDSGSPSLVGSLRGVLDGLPVLGVKVMAGGDSIILLQKKLIQLYSMKSKGGCSGDVALPAYNLTDAKSFDLGKTNVEMMKKIRVLGSRFSPWYMECLRYNKSYNSTRLLFTEVGGRVYASPTGSGRVDTWTWLNNIEDDAKTIGVCTRDEAVRDLQPVPKQHREPGDDPVQIYVIVGGVCGLSVIKLGAGPLCQASTVIAAYPSTRKILADGPYLVGLLLRGVHQLASLRVWHRPASGGGWTLKWRHLDSGHVATCVLPSTGHVVYTEDAWVTVWHPVLDLVINRFSTGGIVGFIRHGYSNFGLVFMSCCLVVWELIEGRRLYMLCSGLEWTGDYRSLVWSDGKSLVLGGVNDQTEIIAFT